MAGVEDLGQVLLRGAADPHPLLRVLRQLRDDLLQLKEQLLAGADELADLVDEEQQPVVVALGCHVRLQFKAQLLGSGIYAGLGNLVTDDVDGKGRDLVGLLEDVVQFRDGQGLSLGVPVEPVLGKRSLELLELPLVLERLLKVLGKGDAELVEPAEGVEFLPDRLREGRLVRRLVADLVPDIEQDRVDLGPSQPLHQVVELRDGRL